MDNKYFKTKSKVFAYAIQYITDLSFYKFQNNNNETIYSFEVDDKIYKKIEELNNIKFS